ncbi:hypothetical protein FH972_004967 [Carpinus fangiana]|uniref:Uncharacterized protein n=1 Tax=Carpinus fangiana TaxID=176857 RepID=A0A5N6QNJ1_9ROSI|nr:hypothetical protein FH972_004967 [Carpinus fangiana]
MNQAIEVEKMSNLTLLLVLALCMSQPLITNAWPSQRPKMMEYTCSMVMNGNIIYKRRGDIDKLEDMQIYYNEVVGNFVNFLQ